MPNTHPPQPSSKDLLLILADRVDERWPGLPTTTVNALALELIRTFGADPTTLEALSAEEIDRRTLWWLLSLARPSVLARLAASYGGLSRMVVEEEIVEAMIVVVTWLMADPRRITRHRGLAMARTSLYTFSQRRLASLTRSPGFKRISFADQPQEAVGGAHDELVLPARLTPVTETERARHQRFLCEIEDSLPDRYAQFAEEAIRAATTMSRTRGLEEVLREQLGRLWDDGGSRSERVSDAELGARLGVRRETVVRARRRAIESVQAMLDAWIREVARLHDLVELDAAQLVTQLYEPLFERLDTWGMPLPQR